LTDIAQLVIAGITSGSIYGIVALAFTLIYNSTKIVNFAQGDFIMVGAMFAYCFLTLKSFQLALALVLIFTVTGLVGFGTRLFVINSLQRRNAPLFSMIISTLAVGIVLSQSMAMVFGKTKFPVPPIIPGDPIHLFAGIRIWPENLTVIIVTLVCVVTFWLFLNRSDLGRSIQAIGYNPEAALLAGLHVSVLVSVTFILSAVISAIGGILISPITGASPYMGLSLGVKGFAATILGGMGNPFAGFVGGLILGLAETLSAYYLSTTYAPAITYIVLLVMLMFKPTGLWPEKEGA
jgi:branched-chain amino acid transport system permease protein